MKLENEPNQPSHSCAFPPEQVRSKDRDRFNLIDNTFFYCNPSGVFHHVLHEMIALAVHRGLYAEEEGHLSGV